MKYYTRGLKSTLLQNKIKSNSQWRCFFIALLYDLLSLWYKKGCIIYQYFSLRKGFSLPKSQIYTKDYIVYTIGYYCHSQFMHANIIQSGISSRVIQLFAHLQIKLITPKKIKNESMFLEYQNNHGLVYVYPCIFPSEINLFNYVDMTQIFYNMSVAYLKRNNKLLTQIG